MRTVVVFTNGGYWGKSDTLPKAMKNAQLKRGQEFSVVAIDCDPKEVTIDDMGTITYPTEAAYINLNFDNVPCKK